MTEDSPSPQPASQPSAEHDWKLSTLAVTTGRPPHVADQPLNVPITMASTYVAGGDLEYGRYANPTWDGFEEALGDEHVVLDVTFADTPFEECVRMLAQVLGCAALTGTFDSIASATISVR